MSARFRRIIHQRAQVSSFETFCSNPAEPNDCAAVKIYSIAAIIIMVFTKLLLENASAIRPCNWEAASEPLLPKVARSIPVLPSRYIGKCAARVLKRSGLAAYKSQKTSVNFEQKGNSTLIVLNYLISIVKSQNSELRQNLYLEEYCNPNRTEGKTRHWLERYHFVVSTLALGLKINFDQPVKWIEFQ